MTSPIIPIKSECAGWYLIEAVKLDEEGKELSRRICADWFPNLITDQGLDRLGANNGWGQFCQVGSGNTPPANTDTSLQTFVAASSVEQSASVSASGSSPYFCTANKTYRFNAGVATGNLSEVGIGWSSGASTLFSRALILDGGGVPTTITVLPDEVLDVTYAFRVYAPLVDIVSTITISGILYNYTLRATNVTTPWASSLNPPFGSWGNILQSFFGNGQSAIFRGASAWSGAIGAITATPSGTNDTASTFSTAAYGTNNLYRDGTAVWDLNDGNVGGIRSVSYYFSWCAYQMEFSPVIAKDNTKTLTLTFRHTWARKTLP